MSSVEKISIPQIETIRSVETNKLLGEGAVYVEQDGTEMPRLHLRPEQIAEIQRIQELKDNATERLIGAVSIDDAVEALFQAGESGENIFVVFNGHKLYSADVNPNTYRLLNGDARTPETIEKDTNREKEERKIAETMYVLSVAQEVITAEREGKTPDEIKALISGRNLSEPSKGQLLFILGSYNPNASALIV